MKVFDLKGFRKAHSIPQKEIMEMLDCVQSYVSQIENGTKPIPSELVDMLREKYDDVDNFLVDGDSTLTPTEKYQAEISRLNELVESQQRTIENLSRLTKLLK